MLPSEEATKRKEEGSGNQEIYSKLRSNQKLKKTEEEEEETKQHAVVLPEIPLLHIPASRRAPWARALSPIGLQAQNQAAARLARLKKYLSERPLSPEDRGYNIAHDGSVVMVLSSRSPRAKEPGKGYFSPRAPFALESDRPERPKRRRRRRRKRSQRQHGHHRKLLRAWPNTKGYMLTTESQRTRAAAKLRRRPQIKRKYFK